MRIILPVLVVSILLSCNQVSQSNSTVASTNSSTVYYNGDILTMEGDQPEYVEALVVANGVIKFAGSLKEAEVQAGKNHQLIDLSGKTLLPGFVDGHSHLTNYADGLMQADLNPPPIGTVTDIPGIIKAVQELKVKLKAKDGELLVGFGYDADMLTEKRHPNATDLDAAFPQKIRLSLSMLRDICWWLIRLLSNWQG